jgi:Zn-finger nucleic acid-binding protein
MTTRPPNDGSRDDPRAPNRPVPLRNQPDPRIRCPKCGGIMERVPVKAAGCIVDRCAACGSLWFDALEMNKVLDHAEAHGDKVIAALDTGALDERPVNASIGQSLGGMVCPHDKSTLINMSHLQQGHVQLDACTVCGGILLDSGELTDLSQHTTGEKFRALLGRFRKR